MFGLFAGCPLTQTIQDASTARAFGDGLLKGEEDKPSTFLVDTQGRRGELNVTVEGPNSVAKVQPTTFVFRKERTCVGLTSECTLPDVSASQSLTRKLVLAFHQLRLSSSIQRKAFGSSGDD